LAQAVVFPELHVFASRIYLITILTFVSSMPSQMLVRSCAHLHVYTCLLLQTLFLQGTALSLQTSTNEQEGGRKGNLAVCISGGIRQGDECAQSHVRSIVEASRKNFRNVKIFFATWADRQCADDTPPGIITNVTESFVREMYPNQDIDVWIGDANGQPLSDVTEIPKPNNVKTNAVFPYKWSYDMFTKCRNMVTLWEKCMDMVPDTYDVIVRIRPDRCFPDNYRIVLSPEDVKVRLTDNKSVFFSAKLEEGKLFMPKNYHHSEDTPNIPDDRMAFGLAKPMKQAFGTLRQRADQHEFDLSDKQYVNKWGTPEKGGGADTALNPHGFWVREPYPEILLAHHLRNRKIKYAFIEPAEAGLFYLPGTGVHCGAKDDKPLRRTSAYGSGEYQDYN